MKRVYLVITLATLLGCATTGGRVAVSVAGAAATGAVVNQFRLLGCDDDDRECRHDVRTAGFVLVGIAAAALITAIVFEWKQPQRASVP
jgi:hypothetical protein